MSAYYNEHDPYAAQWLRNLIAAGHIAPGDVDTRSIKEVTADDLRPYTQCHFFAGIGVWSHALRRAGWRDDWPVWTGSCPCQPFSAAGQQKGFDDDRHLWPVWHRLISECRPSVVLGEQVASALQWLDLVSTDMEASGYAFAAADLCAAGFDGAHIRQRLYFVGMADTDDAGPQGWSRVPERPDQCAAWSSGMVDWLDCRDGTRRPVEPGTLPLADAPAGRVGRLRAYGNALDAETATQFVGAVMESLT